MFQQNGLSLDQAPPISVVFHLFLIASFFGILAGFMILFYQETIFDSASVGAITLTHTLTLGVMVSFMLGALFQMLPVIAGVVLSSPIKRSWWIQVPFALGMIILLLVFNFTAYSQLYSVASLLLGSSLLGAIGIMLHKLIKLPHHSASSHGMMVALLAFAITILLALYLTATLSGLAQGSYYTQVKTLHYHFGLMGWVALLIISISFQVVEMFYVTPPYPKILSRYLTGTMVFLLLLKIPLAFLLPSAIITINTLLALLLVSFAVITLYRFSQRKRPLADASMWFWRLGMGSLILAMLLWIISAFISHPLMASVTYIAFASFALSVVFAMFYKIVPFLTWFHLNAQGYYTAPMMHEVIHPKTAKKHFWIHRAMVIILLLSLFIGKLIFIAGVLTILSFGWISYQIIHAHLLYRKTEKSGEKFDMGK
ncbi:MAG: hypothetical protein DRG30_05485 [Epsilonproteobacteria bacterium]|nr:MAG: hypothetical protein DRG30_05485 [Campylobacterota bacterium]